MVFSVAPWLSDLWICNTRIPEVRLKPDTPYVFTSAGPARQDPAYLEHTDGNVRAAC